MHHSVEWHYRILTRCNNDRKLAVRSNFTGFTYGIEVPDGNFLKSFDSLRINVRLVPANEAQISIMIMDTYTHGAVFYQC